MNFRCSYSTIHVLDVLVALLATRIIIRMHFYAFCTVAKMYNITKKGKLLKKIREKVVFLSDIWSFYPEFCT